MKNYQTNSHTLLYLITTLVLVLTVSLFFIQLLSSSDYSYLSIKNKNPIIYTNNI